MKTSNSLGMKLLMVVVTLVIIGYFGVQAYLYFDDPLSTTVTYTYRVDEGAELSGYVVRTEQVLEDNTNGLLQLTRSEGERVSVGGTVAKTYADQASYDRRRDIDNVTARIEQLEYAQETVPGSETALKLDADILSSVLTYRTQVASDRLDRAEKGADQLRSLVLKRDYAYTDAGDLSGQLEALRAQLQSLQSQAAGSTSNITVKTSGLYSAVVDGFESVLTPETIADMTVSQLRSVSPDSSVSSRTGKLILGTTWQYVAEMPTQQAEKLARQPGLKLRFSKGVEREFPVKIRSVGASENGSSVVIFESREYLAQVTLLRQQTAQVISSTVEGLRIPKDALRAERISLNADGQRVTDQRTGVYCIAGMKAVFKPVQVVYNGDGFLLVQPEVEAGEESILLRAGDEIILTALDLYDGKVVSEGSL